jgi:arginyl-tRNA synthetase
MISFKEQVAQLINNAIENQIEEHELLEYIEIPPNREMGDYAFPCFKLAKVMHKAPNLIAEEIKGKIALNDNFERVEIVGGYLNFFINNKLLASVVLQEIDNKKEEYGKSNIGNGKKVVVEYSSPNIAKPFHIGHLRNTIIGHSLYNIYKYLGYDTISINHLGDYGTQFGKLIEGYKMWGSEYSLEDPISDLMDIYVRISNLCKEDEAVLERCRENFRLLENGDPYCVDLWNRFKDISLKEFNKIYSKLGITFDSLNGESFYVDKIDETIDVLDKAGITKESEGAKIVDLEDKGLGVCIVKKTNGSSIYAARDLSAIRYRAKTYDFDKCLYVVAYEQAGYFKQLFEIAKSLDIPEKCKKGLEHVQYGMVRLTTGKMSTREGNVVSVEELLNEAVSRVRQIIEEKNPDMPNKDTEAQKIGLGAVIFNNLSSTIMKDLVFDWNTVLNFNGETGPYIQYVYVRINSVLEKAGYIPQFESIDSSLLNDKTSIEVLNNLYRFEEVLNDVVNKNEPSILARYLIALGQSFSNFYNENKIILEDKKLQDTRLYLCYAVGLVLKIGCNLLGIEMPDKM